MQRPLPPGKVCKHCRGAQSLVTEECNSIPDWIYQPDRPCLASILVELGVLEDGWANSAILNVYNKHGGKLLAHFDSPHLFERPIIGISLFSAKSLSFGLEGLGVQPEGHRYALRMSRGAVTIMDGVRREPDKPWRAVCGRQSGDLAISSYAPVAPERGVGHRQRRSVLQRACGVAGQPERGHP